jgi:hypothetical protein
MAVYPSEKISAKIEVPCSPTGFGIFAALRKAAGDVLPCGSKTYNLNFVRISNRRGSWFKRRSISGWA